VQPGVLRVELLIDAVPTEFVPGSPAPSQIQGSAATPSESSAQDGTAVSVQRRMAEGRALWGETDGPAGTASSPITAMTALVLALRQCHRCVRCPGGFEGCPVSHGWTRGSLAALCCASRDFRDAVEGAEGVWEHLYLTEIPDTDRVGWETPKQDAVREEPSEPASAEGMDGVVGSGRGGAGRKGLWKACFAAAWRRKREREAREEEARVHWPQVHGTAEALQTTWRARPVLCGVPKVYGGQEIQSHGGDYDRLPGGAMGPYIGGGFGLGGGGVF